MFRAPSQAGLPPFSLLVRDIPASRQEIARHLDLSAHTVAKYETDGAPRAVQLALFWETRWGRSAADCEAAQFGVIQYRLAESLKRENAALLRQIAQLEAERMEWAPSANTPFFQPGGSAWRQHTSL